MGTPPATKHTVGQWVGLVVITAMLVFAIIGGCIASQPDGHHDSPTYYNGPSSSECEARWRQQKDTAALLGHDTTHDHDAFISQCTAGS